MSLKMQTVSLDSIQLPSIDKYQIVDCNSVCGGKPLSVRQSNGR